VQKHACDNVFLSKKRGILGVKNKRLNIYPSTIKNRLFSFKK